MFRFALWRTGRSSIGSSKKRKVYLCFEVRFSYPPSGGGDTERRCCCEIYQLRGDIPEGHGCFWAKLGAQSVSLPKGTFTRSRARKIALALSLAQIQAFSREDRTLIWQCYHWHNPERRRWLGPLEAASARKSIRIAERFAWVYQHGAPLEKIHLRAL